MTFVNQSQWYNLRQRKYRLNFFIRSTLRARPTVFLYSCLLCHIMLTSCHLLVFWELLSCSNTPPKCRDNTQGCQLRQATFITSVPARHQFDGQFRHWYPNQMRSILRVAQFSRTFHNRMWGECEKPITKRSKVPRHTAYAELFRTCTAQSRKSNSRVFVSKNLTWRPLIFSC